MLVSVSKHQILGIILLAILFLNSTCGVWSQDIKPITCCKKVSASRIQTEITDCIIHPKTDECLAAVIFVSDGNMYCTPRNARWVHKKVRELKQEGKPCKNSTS